MRSRATQGNWPKMAETILQIVGDTDRRPYPFCIPSPIASLISLLGILIYLYDYKLFIW